MSNRDDFKPATVRKVAERASFVCSNPSCNRITIGPAAQDHTRSANVGVAAHICAASPHGPRYDMSQSSAERSSIKNAIWLCGTCAALVDKNQGVDYPADHLRKWKKDHESLMQSSLEAGKRVILGMLLGPSDRKEATKLIRLLEYKGAMFQPYAVEDPVRVARSLGDIRSALTDLRGELSENSEVDIAAESIIKACQHYMNTVPDNPSLLELEYSLGAVRKLVGINLSRLLQSHDIRVNPELLSIVPR